MIETLTLTPAHDGAAYVQGTGVQGTGLACRRGEIAVFDNLSFTLKSGEALMLAGPNGSGKTSLLRQVAGLLPVEKGALHLPAAPAQCLHYLGHADGLKPALSVGETLAFETILAGAQSPQNNPLDILGLKGCDWQFVGDLSAGQKRRLTLARLLINPRPLWLLDEPLTALDQQGRALIEQLAKAHMAAGGMIIAASHEALAFATSELRLGDAADGEAAL